VVGTGVGLALSKGLVEAMEGAIGVESRLGEGSTFWIDLLSADRPEGAWLDFNAASEHEIVPECARRCVVLYIEDNPSNLALMQRVAGLRPDVQVLAAEQGGLGLDLARAHRPDLILLDLHLPDMPGLEVLQYLRRNAETRTIPVVVVSADATSDHIPQFMAAGAQSYMTKPFNISSVLRLFDEMLLGVNAS